LKKYPDVAGMVGLWSYDSPAIVQALKPEAKLGTVKIVCFDDERETLAAIKEGEGLKVVSNLVIQAKS
jgi:ribose transport system substrate-binding protein